MMIHTGENVINVKDITKPLNVQDLIRSREFILEKNLANGEYIEKTLKLCYLIKHKYAYTVGKHHRYKCGKVCRALE